ncbi:MAG: hypothetical protein D3903_05020 [Candidatus Electrothrix sp. GM3_4]|nr:hypothetical protein [Candidatus Electrothrix sp. GM3_4]
MPPLYSVDFAGLSVVIRCDNREALNFLNFLFGDLHGPTRDPSPSSSLYAVDTAANTSTILTISFNEGLSEGEEKYYTLTDSSGTLFTGSLSVQFAAVLFDQVIFHLLNHLKNGVALHSGAVVYQGKTILLPGQSGSGKSTVSAWLTSEHSACRCSYLTDELVVLPENDSGSVIPFPRPLCIKAGATAAIRAIIPKNGEEHILADEQGALVPHRLLNPDFNPDLNPELPFLVPPVSLILFPTYQTSSPLQVEKISAARTSALLMTCDVNARNLADHGFHQLVQLARSIPAYRIFYSSFTEFNELLPDLFAQAGLST